MKGKPDFSAISDLKLKEYIDLAQQMIFSYQYCDEEKSRVMREVWKQMSDEYADRVCNAPIEPESSPSTIHKIKTVKVIKRIKH